VIEIGPGIGALTEQLALQAGHVVCYEIDPDMVNVLTHELEAGNVEIFGQDFMKVDLDAEIDKLSSQWSDFAVVTNLPYYITSPIIEKIVLSRAPVTRMVCTVQDEVAKKITNDWLISPLNLFIRFAGKAEYRLSIPARFFIPAPHVDSAVLVITKEREVAPEVIEVIRAAFTQKRKTLYNNLKPLFRKETADVLEACELDPKIRPEQMSPLDFQKLADERKKRL